MASSIFRASFNGMIGALIICALFSGLIGFNFVTVSNWAFGINLAALLLFALMLLTGVISALSTGQFKQVFVILALMILLFIGSLSSLLGYSLYEGWFVSTDVTSEAPRFIVGEYRDLLVEWLSSIGPSGQDLVELIKDYQLVPALISLFLGLISIGARRPQQA